MELRNTSGNTCVLEKVLCNCAVFMYTPLTDLVSCLITALSSQLHKYVLVESSILCFVLVPQEVAQCSRRLL